MAEKVDEKDKRIKELEKQLKESQKELNRKTDALAELAAIYTLKKSLPRTMGLWTRKNDECRAGEKTELLTNGKVLKERFQENCCRTV